MKHLFLLGLGLILLSAGCNSCTTEAVDREYDVMTRYGAWEARLDETRKEVDRIKAAIQELTLYELDTVTRSLFDSEYVFWDKIHVHARGDQIVHAKLFAMPDQSAKTEEFYFKDGQLIYAERSENGLHIKPDDPGQSETFFFTEQVLVEALDHHQERRDITDDTVKLASVELIHEAGQLQKIITQKQIKL